MSSNAVELAKGKRYAIRTIKAPAKYLDKDGLLVDSPQDARLYYRKGDCTNSLNVLFTRAAWRGPRLEGSKEDYEVIGMVVITASEWDLIEASQADREDDKKRLLWLDALESAGVDNWSGMEFAQDEYRDMLKEAGLEDDD